jgi:murein DD-endopeptidase MepM/ murein hydrolase activator NlpD
MRNLFLALILFFSNPLFAQTPAYRHTTDRFVSFYNKEQYDSIFSLFSIELKALLPLDKTTEFFLEQHTHLGSILKRDFLHYAATYAVYNTSFEKDTLVLNLSVNSKGEINGIQLLPLPKRNVTKMQLPFKGEWTVFWGGDVREQNYHVVSNAQKNAFDIVITDTRGRTFKTDGFKNEDYYAFGKALSSPCDGEVVKADDGVEDNNPNEMNELQIFGNSVIIKTDKNEYVLFAHLKKGSVKVVRGQQVKRGQLIGLCGNSGHSSEPHLHFHIQDSEDPNTATGVKCYFDKVVVNGKVKMDYSPVKNDKIKTEKVPRAAP